MRRRAVVTNFLTIGAIGLPWPAAAAAQRRVALVIGNSAYQYVTPLVNPAHDAQLIGRTLAALNFTLIGNQPMLDLNQQDFAGAIAAFGEAIIGADVALFYYSGHGLQVGATNWLVPVSARPETIQDVNRQMVSVDLVLQQLQNANPALGVVILDACRDNPFPGLNMQGAGDGLAQMTAPNRTIICYSTQPGNVAVDGSGANSPYTAALAQAMQSPGLNLFQTFNAVGLAVEKATNGAQQPWTSSSPIADDFYFAGRGKFSTVVTAYDGHYVGQAQPGTGCVAIHIDIDVTNGTASGTASKILYELYGPSSVVHGAVAPDGSVIFSLTKNSDRSPGAAISGQFAPTGSGMVFTGSMGGLTAACQRSVNLTRQ